MPLVGLMMGKIESRKLLITGILVSSFSFYRLSHLSLDAGYWNFFWPLIIQGSAMGFLFVPLTTITNDPVPKEEIGNAASLFNLMRNLGASIGIATVTTIVSRHQQTHTSPLGEHVTGSSLTAQSMLQGMQATLMARGIDAATASRQAYAMLFGTVQRQAAIMSFNDAFFLLMVLFLLMIPLVFVMRKAKHAGGSVAVH
jgi:DHA2 family multidrug resistance protein